MGPHATILIWNIVGFLTIYSFIPKLHSSL
jgi:hypothetical protein